MNPFTPITFWNTDDVLIGHQLLTNQDEGDGDDVAKQVGSQWFVVLPVTLRKEPDVWVDVVSAQTLADHKKRFRIRVHSLTIH